MLRPKEFDRGNIYLSGGMQFAEGYGTGWREIASKRLKEMQYFPLDIARMDDHYKDRYGKLYLPSSVENHVMYKSNVRKHFIFADLNLIEEHSDALIVLYDESVRRGAGTISECQFAYLHHIPIFMISSYKNMDEDIPGWLQALSTKIFFDFEEMYSYFENLPYGILRKDIYGNHRSENKYLCHLCGDVFEKKKNIFVSKVAPLYCGSCVEAVSNTHNRYKDRYEFFVEYLDEKIYLNE